MDKIIFNANGWKGIIAKDFTIANVAKVVSAFSRWLVGKSTNPSVVVGYDCRFGGEMFMEAVTKVLASKGVRVFVSEGAVSSPMLCLGIKELEATGGLMLTAGQSAASFNGIRLMGEHAGPMFYRDVNDVQNLISDEYEFDVEILNWNQLIEQNKIQYINLESIYIKYLYDTDPWLDGLKENDSLIFDCMHGSTRDVIKKLFPRRRILHNEPNNTLKSIPPEPIEKNVFELTELIRKDKKGRFGIAFDGEGECISIVDEEGNYVNSHLILLMAVFFLAKGQKEDTKILADFAVTHKLDTICKHFNLPLERCMLGYSNLSEAMIKEQALLGGGESGNICLRKRLPTADAVNIGLQLIYWFQQSKKSVAEIVNKIYAITGFFSIDKSSIKLDKSNSAKIIEACNRQFEQFGNYRVIRTETLDGHKYFFNETEWALIITYPNDQLVKIYAEAETKEKASDIIQTVKNELLNI